MFFLKEPKVLISNILKYKLFAKVAFFPLELIQEEEKKHIYIIQNTVLTIWLF